MNSIEKAWRELLKKVLTYGKWVVKDDGDEIFEVVDNHCFIPNVADSVLNSQVFSLELFKKMILDGQFNVDGYPIKNGGLLSYVESLEDDKLVYLTNDNGGEKPFVYTYPERLLNVHQVTRNDEIVDSNQVETIINRLKEHSGSNRGVANLYMCSLDKDETHIPCLQVVQALIRDNKLSLHVFFRSNDCYSAFVGNMFFLSYLGLKIVEELKTEYPSLHFNGIYYSSSSLHIYRGDYEQALKTFKERR